MARKPTQQRALATYERLLDAAGEVLEVLGVERISTNLVAARAGVTPPTLYHYFADKYALLAALGERLMRAQNALVLPGDGLDEAAIAQVLLDHVAATRESSGGPWIMRMLRAVPQLAHVRLASHRALSAVIVDEMQRFDPSRERAALEHEARLVVDIGYAAIELVFDEPALDERAIMASAARAIRALLIAKAPLP